MWLIYIFIFVCVQEGTIGHDLVVKPVPATVRQHLDDEPPADDDELFLDDEGEDLEDDVAVSGGFPLKGRRRRALSQTHRHIVYRRSPNEGDSFSDYG